MAPAGEVDAEIGEAARPQVMDEYIGASDHRVEQREIVAAPQIETDRFLAAVQPDEISTLTTDNPIVAARKVSLGRLDLHHPRAEVSEPAGAERCGDGLLERYHQELRIHLWAHPILLDDTRIERNTHTA